MIFDDTFFSRKSLKIWYWIHEIQVMAAERIVEPDYKVDKVDLNWGRIGVTQSTHGFVHG